MVSLALGIIVLLTRLTHGFITCKCDNAECYAMNSECKTEVSCYVSFRLAKLSDRKTPTSKGMYGAGSQLFIAEHRGCVPPDQLPMCREHPAARDGGDIEKISVEEGDRDHPPIIQCCHDNWCNVGQELVLTRAELDGRQFFLNPEISNLEPGLGSSMLSSKSSVNNFDPHNFADSQDHTNQPFNELENSAAAVAASDRQHRKWLSYVKDIPQNQRLSNTPLLLAPSPFFISPSLISPTGFGLPGNLVTDSKGDDNYASTTQLKTQHLQGGEVGTTVEEGPLPVIVLKPSHIVIGVCLIILTLVTILLHVVVLLHRRHRRLKRELIKQTQSHHWPFITTSPTASQSGRQRIGLLHLKPPLVAPEIPNKCNGRWGYFSCVWKRPQAKPPPSNCCFEALSHQAAATTSEKQIRQCLPPGTSVFTQAPVTSNEDMLRTCSSPHNSVHVIPHLPNSPALTQQQLLLLQPAMYSPHAPEYSHHMSTTKNAYGTGSSVSGGGGKNPSTTESSLPTQSSGVTGWNNASNSVSLHNGHALERPSLSGSSKGDGLVTPDFETRRANVALPPALRGEDRRVPPMYSSPINTINLTLFRWAVEQNEVSSLVTPYAQLPLVHPHDQYDTPEQILGNDSFSNSSSTPPLDGFGRIRNHTGSIPTTKSSLLQSDCENGGSAADFRV